MERTLVTRERSRRANSAIPCTLALAPRSRKPAAGSSEDRKRQQSKDRPLHETDDDADEGRIEAPGSEEDDAVTPLRTQESETGEDEDLPDETQLQEIYVRKLTIAVLAIAGAPAFAVAQDADSDARQTTRAADHEDRMDWGWLGLLGLAGLSGLKRRDREEVVRSDRATAR
jgi:hypothetical protein